LNLLSSSLGNVINLTSLFLSLLDCDQTLVKKYAQLAGEEAATEQLPRSTSLVV